jgi:hypothetical protein
LRSVFFAGGVSIAIAHLAMPRWRESAARKTFAGRLMVVEAVLTAVIGSIVKRALW